MCMTVFWKTNRIDTNTEIHFLPVDKSHSYSCTIKRHQALETSYRWPGMLLQAAFFRHCQTTRVHFMASMAPEGH